MRRLLIVFFLALLGLALVVPALIGVLAQRQAVGELARLTARQPAIKIAEGEFQRGWFSSSSSHVLLLDTSRLWPPALGGQSATLPVLVLTLESTYRHGPLPSAPLVPELARILTRFTLGEPDAPNPLSGEAETWLHLQGGGESRISFLPLQVEHASRYGGIDWPGGHGTLEFDRGFRVLAAAAELQVVQIRDVEGALTVGPLQLHAELAHHRGLWTGDVRADIARMDAWTRRSPRSQTLARAMVLTGSSSLADERVTLVAEGTVERMQLLGRESRNLGGRMRLQGLDAPQLRGLGGLWREAVRDGLSREVLLARLQQRGVNLAGAGASVALEALRADLHYGPLEASLALELPAQPGGHDLQTLLRDLEGNTRWRLPEGLVKLGLEHELTRTSLELLLGLRVLQAHAQGYRLDVGYRAGLLNVNGIPMVLPVPQASAVPAQ